MNEKILSQKRFWFAASTHREEDNFCLQTHLKIKDRYKEIITIIAPRHIDRVKSINSLAQKYNLNTQILNKHQKILSGSEIIIINYFGALHQFFKYAKSVFIGKSMIEKLKKDGGQNPIEAAKLNCKIYHGPYVYNFKEIYDLLEKHNIAKMIINDTELSENLIYDLENASKLENDNSDLIINLGQKILTDTMKYIDNFLND